MRMSETKPSPDADELREEIKSAVQRIRNQFSEAGAEEKIEAENVGQPPLKSS